MILRACAWTSGEVAAAVEGELVGRGDRALAGVSTDTRDPLVDQLFVALSGERFDAHDFLADAVKKGAGALLVSRAGLARARGLGAEVPLVVVGDTLHALGDLGAFHRRRSPARVVALTGSNGKTTTKEMIASILGVSRRVLKTEGNLNNLIGVPMTLLGLTAAHQVAVIEMGMNTRGEIARYTEIASPDVGVVINVGPAHIGLLGSLDAIGDAKGELYRGLDGARAVAVVNADDPQVVRVFEASGLSRARTFGERAGADVRLTEYTPVAGQGGVARYLVDGRAIEVKLPLPGAHNARNGAAAIAAATADPALPISLDDLAPGLESAAAVKGRLRFEPVGPYLLVDDCYNANSASMLAAIETVSAEARAREGRLVALLGEMRELGDFSAREHRAVGEALAAKAPALVGAFGAGARPIADAVASAGLPVHHESDDVDALFRWLSERLRPGDVILVKGSRGIAMERFIERLRATKETG